VPLRRWLELPLAASAYERLCVARDELLAGWPSARVHITEQHELTVRVDGPAVPPETCHGFRVEVDLRRQQLRERRAKLSESSA
jgi:hypothetical protein